MDYTWSVEVLIAFVTFHGLLYILYLFMASNMVVSGDLSLLTPDLSAVDYPALVLSQLEWSQHLH